MIKIHGFNMDPIFGDMRNKTGSDPFSGDNNMSQGGLSEDDIKFKNYLYDQIYNLPETYEGFDGQRYAEMSPEEQATLDELKAGGGYSGLYDTARTNLGLAGDVYSNQMNMSNADLIQQAREFRNPFEAEMQGQIQRQLTQGLANANMANNASAFGAGAGGGSRQALAMQPTQEALFRGAGDAMANLSYNTYADSINQARQANRDRMAGASAYGQYVNQDLGLGVGGLDKDFGTRMGAFAQQRGFEQRDLDFDYEEDVRRRMFPFSRLSTMADAFGAIPIEEKIVKNEPAEGGKSGLF